jgi:4-alpha-glucanotransferase
LPDERGTSPAVAGQTHPLSVRRAGVLCHITSLPPSSCERFLAWLESSGLSVWQVLPLHPPDKHRSPYNSRSLFALDPSLRGRIEIAPDDIWIDRRAFEARHRDWLDDYVLFECACEEFGDDWRSWPEHIRRRHPDGLEALRTQTARIGRLLDEQYEAHRAWLALKAAANRRGVLLLGDMPLYPALDSADTWANVDLLELGDSLEVRWQAGVPPDYFAATGQLWGNPVWNWARLEETGFAWWRRRVARLLELFDVIRIDHFRGLSAFWAIPGGAADARQGEWRSVPGAALLDSIRADVGALPLVAEDLGTIDDAVNELREAFGLPGMRVLQFGFDGNPGNPHLARNVDANSVVYTGTHDNNTTVGWYRSLDEATRRLVDAGMPGEGSAAWRMIEVACASRANTAIVPMQDFLELDEAHRMNVPGTPEGNWRWQFDWQDVPDGLTDRIADVGRRSARCPEA